MKSSVYISLLAILLFSACKEKLPEDPNFINDLYWLEHKGAQMPIWLDGNSENNTLILILHGGPGGNSLVYNDVLPTFSKNLEERYMLAYWDQRSSGNARGNYDKEAVSLVQMSEDLDSVIELLRDRLGSDLKIFLLGHSWGGYLGNYYLLNKLSQDKISGWIDVDGAHNIRKLSFDGLALMDQIARQQIAADTEQQEEWREILDFVTDFDTTEVLDTDDFIEINIRAGRAEVLAYRDDLIQVNVPELEGLWRHLAGANHPLTGLVNSYQITRTNLLDEAIDLPLTDQLDKIKVPTLLLWGKLDFIVPPSLGEEMLEKLGTPEERKSLIIYENSGHSPMDGDAEDFVQDVIEFIELYREE
ncbi:MAG: alpha/beta hydrolase [Bacteroidota bacterium]